MNILIIQENGQHEKNRHFRECFSMARALSRQDCEVDVWGKGHTNYDNTPEWDSYDLIVNLENYDLSGWVPDLSGITKPKKMLWVIDAHCRGMQPYMQTFIDGRYDLILQATKDFLNKDSVWFPNCYDNHLIRPFSDKRHFIGFCGSLLNRAPILDFLEKKYSLKKDIWVLGEDMVSTVSSYKIQFNMNLANDINYRSFETIGCGTLLLTNANPQYDELGFVDGYNCLIYENFKTLCDKIQYCIDNPEEVSSISNKGLELAKSHTYDIRAKKLISIYRELT